MIEMTLAMSARVCEVCQLHEYKYKCPKCLKKTCCLECTKSHKEKDQCSGTAFEPAGYIASEALKEADTQDEANVLVQRDYNFLIGMNRQLELLKRDGKTKNKRVLATHHVQQHLKRPRTDQPPYVIRRGVHCLLLPKGMQKSLQNKSKWDKPLDQFVWTIEWCLLDSEGSNSFSHLSHRNKETDTLIDCVGKLVYEKCCDMYGIKHETDDSNKEKRSEALVLSGIQFFIKWFPKDTQMPSDSKKLVPLDPSKKIGELLRDKTVIEFPTVFIAQNEDSIGKKFLLVNTMGEIIKSKTQEDSSSDDSDSSEDSSSSESSTDDSSSDEDEAPTEAPSKLRKTTQDDDEDDEEDDYTPGISLDFLAD